VDVPPRASHDGDGVDLDEKLGGQASDDVDRDGRRWVGLSGGVTHSSTQKTLYFTAAPSDPSALTVRRT
jgi:hypothetical protein